MCQKFQRMEGNEHQLNQYELVVPEVMGIHREEGVFPSCYPCLEFMRSSGILRDFRTLVSNTGLSDFVEGEPYQYAKLTVSVVQDFRFDWSSPNPMVHYKIYNKSVHLPFDAFCAAIRVPQWGSRGKIHGQPKHLTDLYEVICQGRTYSDESGKIRSIQFPCIRYFAYFITRCVLARKSANKLSIPDLAFLAAALQHDKSYNLGALIAFRIAANREKGGFCGLIASRLLAMHGVVALPNDLQLSLERLDFASMGRHGFVTSWSTLNNLSYEVPFAKKVRWKMVKSERIVALPAPRLFDLGFRNVWSVTEDEFDAYLREHALHTEDDGEWADEDSTQFSGTGGSRPYPGDAGPSASSSSAEPDVEHAQYDPPVWSSYPRYY